MVCRLHTVAEWSASLPHSKEDVGLIPELDTNEFHGGIFMS